MGHSIRAIIGKHGIMQRMAADWVDMKEIQLPQDYGMIFLTDALLDDIMELLEATEMEPDDGLDFFDRLAGSAPVAAMLLRTYSFREKLIYVETDYFGGAGTQAGVLYENGKVAIGPQRGEGTIDRLLRELGVWCKPGQDEFDALDLGKYRRMDKWVL